MSMNRKYHNQMESDHNMCLSYTFSQYLITCFLTAVRHEVNNLESSVVVQELELAINLAL